jgi:hypothetical protein
VELKLQAKATLHKKQLLSDSVKTTTSSPFNHCIGIGRKFKCRGIKADSKLTFKV